MCIIALTDTNTVIRREPAALEEVPHIFTGMDTPEGGGEKGVSLLKQKNA